jgi:hypothetical protein
LESEACERHQPISKRFKAHAISDLTLSNDRLMCVRNISAIASSVGWIAPQPILLNVSIDALHEACVDRIPIRKTGLKIGGNRTHEPSVPAM